MENPRSEKVAVVTEVRERLTSSSAALLTEYRGLKVKDLAGLRRTLADAGGDYKIYKNTLVRFAARDLELDALDEMLVGPTGIVFVDGDAVSVAKVLRDYARTNPTFVVKGGVLGRSVLSPADAGALADLPSREQLLAQIAGTLAAPLQTFAGLLQALPRNFAYGLKALIDQGGAPGGAGGTATVDALPDAAGEAATGTAGADAGLPDADVPDPGLPDAGLPDPGLLDAGLPDAGSPETSAAGTPAAEPVAAAVDGPGIPDQLPESPAPDEVSVPPADDAGAGPVLEAPPELPESPAPDAFAVPSEQPDPAVTSDPAVSPDPTTEQE